MSNVKTKTGKAVAQTKPTTKKRDNSKALEAARQVRASQKTPKYSEDPIGHCKGRLGLVSRLLDKIAGRTNRWVSDDPGTAESISGVSNGVIETSQWLVSIMTALDNLSAVGFVPKSTRVRGKRIDIVPGMQVWLKQDAWNTFVQEGFTPEQLDNLVLSKYAQPDDVFVLVRVEKNEPGYPSLGHVHRKNLTSDRPLYVTEGEATETVDAAE